MQSFRKLAVLAAATIALAVVFPSFDPWRARWIRWIALIAVVGAFATWLAESRRVPDGKARADRTLLFWLLAAAAVGVYPATADPHRMGGGSDALLIYFITFGTANVASLVTAIIGIDLLRSTAPDGDGAPSTISPRRTLAAAGILLIGLPLALLLSVAAGLSGFSCSGGAFGEGCSGGSLLAALAVGGPAVIGVLIMAYKVARRTDAPSQRVTWSRPPQPGKRDMVGEWDMELDSSGPRRSGG